MKAGIAIRAVAAAVLAIGAVAVPSGLAQSPEARVEARQEYMKAVGGAARAAGDYFQKGEGSLDDVRKALATLGDKAPDLADQFPEGTGVGVADSEALPAIWDRPDAFSEVVGMASERWQAAAVAAEDGDEAALRAAFARAGQSCGACHEDFRQQN